MDDPTVKYFKEFSAKLKNENYHSFVHIGSCSLYIAHGTIQIDAEKSEWALKKLLKGASIIFLNTPATKEDYESVTGYSTYPRSFSYELYGLSLLYFQKVLLRVFS